MQCQVISAKLLGSPEVFFVTEFGASSTSLHVFLFVVVFFFARPREPYAEASALIIACVIRCFSDRTTIWLLTFVSPHLLLPDMLAILI